MGKNKCNLNIKVAQDLVSKFDYQKVFLHTKRCIDNSCECSHFILSFLDRLKFIDTHTFIDALLFNIFNIENDH